jgi:hypothetical protein
VSRPARFAASRNGRQWLKGEVEKVASLEQRYPSFAEVHVTFEFEDGTKQPPSSQSFTYFPAARSPFRYPCPCHGCNGEFELHEYIAELAATKDRTRLTRHVTLACPGQRIQAREERVACPIRAGIRFSATMRTPELPE